MDGDSNITTKKMRRYSAISLVEGLLILIGLAVISALVVIFLDPAGKMAEGRNEHRTAQINEIISAISTYASENEGALPQDIPVSSQCSAVGNEICATGAGDCSGKVELNVLTKEGKYLESIPKDPKVSSKNGVGYNIVQNESGRITVCAPLAELDKEISITR